MKIIENEDFASEEAVREIVDAACDFLSAAQIPKEADASVEEQIRKGNVRVTIMNLSEVLEKHSY